MPLEVKMAGEGGQGQEGSMEEAGHILFLHLDADLMVYLLCENSPSCTLMCYAFFCVYMSL